MEMFAEATVVASHESGRQTGEFLAFTLGGHDYAVTMRRVHEIRAYETPTTIPNAPCFVKGVQNLRGTLMPIIDLRLKTGCASAECNDGTVVIVLDVRGRLVGAVVDAVAGVVEHATTTALLDVDAMLDGWA